MLLCAKLLAKPQGSQTSWFEYCPLAWCVAYGEKLAEYATRCHYSRHPLLHPPHKIRRLTFSNCARAQQSQLYSTNSIRKVPEDLAITSFHVQCKLTEERQMLCCHSTISRGLTSKVSTTDKPANSAATQTTQTARTRPPGQTFVSPRNSATQRNTQGVAPLACDGSHLLLSATAIQRHMTEIIYRKHKR